MAEATRTIKVVDRRMFTAEGDLRDDVKEELSSAPPAPEPPPAAAAPAPVPGTGWTLLEVRAEETTLEDLFVEQVAKSGERA